MPDTPKGTVLAFDFGEARIGVAQGDAELGMTHPLATVTGNSNDKSSRPLPSWSKNGNPSILWSACRHIPMVRSMS